MSYWVIKAIQQPGTYQGIERLEGPFESEQDAQKVCDRMNAKKPRAYRVWDDEVVSLKGEGT